MAGLSSILSPEMVENSVLSNKLIERAYNVAVSFGNLAPSKRLYSLKDGHWDVIYVVSHIPAPGKSNYVYSVPSLRIVRDGNTVFSTWGNVPYPSSAGEPVIKTENGKTWAISEFNRDGWETSFLLFYAGKTGKTEPPILPNRLACEDA